VAERRSVLVFARKHAVTEVLNDSYKELTQGFAGKNDLHVKRANALWSRVRGAATVQIEVENAPDDKGV
jgi:hypothetical protein